MLIRWLDAFHYLNLDTLKEKYLYLKNGKPSYVAQPPSKKLDTVTPSIATLTQKQKAKAVSQWDRTLYQYSYISFLSGRTTFSAIPSSTNWATLNESIFLVQL